MKDAKHILVLDDDIFTRKLIAMMLERDGYRVSMAANAGEALRILQQEPPVDAITCDLMMPDTNGLHFIQSLKEDPRFASIPIVVITAAGLHGAIEKVRQAGVSAVIEKPFLDTPLRDALRKALGTE